MQPSHLYKYIRGASFTVLGLMLIAVLYSFVMIIMHWTGINV